MFHRTHTEDSDPEQTLPKPCPQMKGLLSALADGTLDGIARRYADFHVKDCPNCNATLVSLQRLRDRLRTLGISEPTEEEVRRAFTASQRATLEAALVEVDSRA